MCGIAGIVKQNLENDYKNQIEAMVHSLRHRGPDGEGIFLFDSCLLGHARLSIVDLNTGNQPMLSNNDSIGITFNGEIYGYKDIKKSLIDYKFKTSSDTEVILALYDKYGSNMVKYLPGAFAFSIWDNNKKTLFSARDRFGEKPFYYAFGENGEFIFASEIKSILASGLLNPIIDKDSISHYLKHLYVNPQKTIYKNIFVLPPAHQLEFRNGELKISRYWSFPEVNEKINEEEAILKFRDLLEKSINKQLVADVPVGVFLSGGLDSSTIVAVASKFKENLQTFSFGFGSSINELPFAREIAEKYSTNHKELGCNFKISEMLIKMNDVYDEPFADSSNIPTYLISKEASKYVKVALGGDAGDELFGGYDWYIPYLYNEKGKFIFDGDISFLFWKIISKLNKSSKNKLYQAVAKKMYSQKKNVFDFHKSQNQYFSDKQIKKMGLGSVGKDKPSWHIYNNVDDAFRSDLSDYMPGDILVKTDRASLYNGLELRSPFLDVDFASFCIGLPGRLKITKSRSKYILRKAYEKEWTESIRGRSKQGFGAPVKEWLKMDDVIDLKNKYLVDKNNKIYNIISYKEAQKVIKKDNYKTWILLVLSLWCDKNL